VAKRTFLTLREQHIKLKLELNIGDITYFTDFVSFCEQPHAQSSTSKPTTNINKETYEQPVQIRTEEHSTIQ
jgi:hypothetical protein